MKNQIAAEKPLASWGGGSDYASAIISFHRDGTATLKAREHRASVSVRLSRGDLDRLSSILNALNI